jgi:O-antigen/teichoic acid export membrane protein
MASTSLWRSAGPLVVGRAALTLFGIALPMVLARLLDQHQYGTWKQLYLVGYTGSLSLQFGIAQSLLYLLPRAEAPDRRRWSAQTQALLSLLGIAAFLGVRALAPWLAARFSNPQLLEIATPMALMTGAMLASSALELTLTASGKPKWSAVALVGTDLVRIAAILTPVVLGYGVVGVAWGAAAAVGVRWLVSVLVTTGLALPSLRRERLRTQLAYALPIGLTVLVSMPQSQLHQIFVASSFSPAQFAIYSVGVMQLPVVTLLYVPVSETMQVRLAALERSGETHKAGGVFSDAVEKLGALFLPFSALMAAVALPAIALLYGPGYAAAAPILQVAMVSVAVASLPVDGVMKARGRTRTLFFVQLAKLALTWPVLHAGATLGGMLGIIGAQVALEAGTKFVLLGIISRELKAGIGSLLGGAQLGRAALVACLAGGVGSGAAGLFESRLQACAGGGLAAATVMGVDFLLRRREGKKRRMLAAPDAAKAA